MREFDVVVIGAGVAGEVAAGRLGENGASVAVVEDRLVGGECSYYACMPSKALLRPVELAREVARIPGLELGPIDVPAVLARRDEVIHDQDDSTQLPWLDGHHVTLVRGHGRLAGEKRVAVGEEELVAREAVIVATGSAALIPDIEGLHEARPWTNIEATTAKQVPPRLAVLGGGVVGVELSQVWSTYGSQVTLVHRGDRLIEREEPFASDQVLDGLERERRRREARAQATRVTRNGAVTVALDDGMEIEADEVLAAFGRVPRTADDRPGDDRPRDRRAAARRRRPPRARLRLALLDRRRQRARPPHPHGEVPGPSRSRRDPRASGRAALRRRPLAARDLHRPAGRGGRAHARGRPRGGPAGQARRRGDERRTRAAPSSAGMPRARRASSSTRSGGSSSAPRSRAPRWPRRCTPPRSPSSAKCRWTTSGTRCRRSRRGASCG